MQSAQSWTQSLGLEGTKDLSEDQTLESTDEDDVHCLTNHDACRGSWCVCVCVLEHHSNYIDMFCANSSLGAAVAEDPAATTRMKMKMMTRLVGEVSFMDCVHTYVGGLIAGGCGEKQQTMQQWQPNFCKSSSLRAPLKQTF